jgi:predicted membrane protein (TIGR00267 family)
VPNTEAEEVAEVFRSYGLTDEQSKPLVEALRQQPEAWIDFMMRFELGLEKPNPKRALVSAATIGGAYVIGGFIPLGPYIFLDRAGTALVVSVVVTLLALTIFGYIKGRFTGTNSIRSALETTLIGGVAATAAFLIARAVS